jgi:hypothetical protein
MRTKSHNAKSIIVAAVAVLSLGLMAPGCALLEGALALLGIELLGVTPARDFNETGNLNFSLFGREDSGTVSAQSLQDLGIDVQVENEDGTMSECDFVDESPVRASRYNSLAVVIDDSGSMERSYPEEEYQDLCLTCPHDPQRVRADAAEELINVLQQDAPDTRIGVMDFGPDPDLGWDATRVLADFQTGGNFNTALSAIDGTQMAGTPMWDALAEIVLALDTDADEYEAALLTAGVLETNPRPAGDLPGSDPEDTDGPTVNDPDGTNGDVINAPSEDSVLRYIVVLSDGDDRDSDNYDLDGLIALAQQHDVVIHAIGLGAASSVVQDPRLQSQGQTSAVTNLQRLAEETGGFYAAANDPNALVAMYHNIADSLSSGYQVETYSCTPAETDGAPADPQAIDPGTPVEGTLTVVSSPPCRGGYWLPRTTRRDHIERSKATLKRAGSLRPTYPI